jgi:RimJ/RimL family protein N-acetyltransferase
MEAVSSIVVRPGVDGDIEGAWHCVDVVAREKAYLSFLEGPPIEESRKFWNGLIENGHPFQVAVDGRLVVGWCDITPIARPALSHIGVLGMGLLPSHREAGIGRRLLASTLEQARAFGLERVELHVFSTNVRARRLYGSLGFTLEAVLPRRVKIDGLYQDEILMALAL